MTKKAQNVIVNGIYQCLCHEISDEFVKKILIKIMEDIINGVLK